MIFSCSLAPPRETAWGMSAGRRSISSTVPKCLMSAVAVTSPTPGIPGTSSILSPRMAMYSITWSGRTPSFFSTSAGPVQPPRPLASAMGS